MWKSQYSLKEFIDPKNFKSYDELQKKLEDVLCLNVPTIKNSVKEESSTKRQTVETYEDEDDDDLKQFKSLVA